MSARGFKSVFMVGAIASAALGCYLVSLRVASERAALESVENKIVLAQRDIRILNTEIGTRGRLAQLERWNVKVIRLSAPTADQFVENSFQLATLAKPDARPAIEVPVVLAKAPAAPRNLGPIVTSGDAGSAGAARPSRPLGDLMHVASYAGPGPRATRIAMPPASRVAAVGPAASSPSLADKPAGAKFAGATPKAASKPVKIATADPLRPLSVARHKAKSDATEDGGAKSIRTTVKPIKDPGSH